jgi:hypothetical protein
MEQRDFMISYNKGDKAWALWVADALKRHGYSVYFQEQDSIPGTQFPQFMDKALKNCNGFIAIWSRAYEKSYFCECERSAAFKKSANRTFQFIVIKVDDCDIDGLYGSYVYLDIFQCNEAEALKKLIKTTLKYPGELGLV